MAIVHSTLTDNLLQNLAYWADTSPAKPAVVVDGNKISFAELNDRSQRFAAGLAERGVGKGSTVGILMGNCVAFVESMYAIMKAGAAIVLLNIRFTPAELKHPILDSGLCLLLVDAEHANSLSSIGEYAPQVEVYSVNGVGGFADFSLLLDDDSYSIPMDVVSEDIALISYTSGTTGTPKGAMISHGAIYAAGVARAYVVGQTREDRLLIPMPMAYTAGAVFLMRDGINSGCTTYFLSRPTGDAMLRLIEKERITSVQGVTVLFEAMLNSPLFATANLSSVTHAQTGGAAVTMHLLESWQARGVQLVQGYGQTESAGSHIALLRPEDSARKMGFAGRPMPNLTVRIVDENGGDQPANVPGEILVRGSSIMSGYLNNTKETERALADGWLHTGDIGLLDEDGFLRIVDRTKDMLISGGLNVYPAEIEKVLGDLPGFEDFCVIGVRDQRWGEVPLIVVSRIDRISLEKIVNRCRDNLADFKRPRYVVGHNGALPRTFSGKISKVGLREAYDSNTHALIGLRYK